MNRAQPSAAVCQLEDGRWQVSITLPGFGARLRTFETEGEANEHVLDMVEVYRLSAEKAA